MNGKKFHPNCWTGYMKCVSPNEVLTGACLLFFYYLEQF